MPITTIQSDYVIILEGTIGKSYDGDISVDDIEFLDYSSSCTIEPGLALPTTTTRPPTTTQGSVYGWFFL